MSYFEMIVEGEFSAAHQLRMYDGRLEPLHGHNWKVEVHLSGPRLDKIGVLADFTLIRAKLNEALAELHDRFLNELPPFAQRNPSAENVALHLYDRLKPHEPMGAHIAKVRVWEATGCAAAFVADAI